MVFFLANTPNSQCHHNTPFLIRLQCILGETQSSAQFSLPSRKVSGVERQSGVVRVVCGLFVHFLCKSVLLTSASETS